VTVEQMFNIFPFDNSISKMQLSGLEVQDLFDFVARRSAGRGCVSQVQIAGARVVIDCTKVKEGAGAPGVASNIYIGMHDPPIYCKSDADCPGDTPASKLGACDYGSTDSDTGRCWQAIEPIASYELATSNYLAQGGSGFRVLQRNTTQLDTLVQQRDALIDYIRAGAPCGSDDSGQLRSCETDADCEAVGEGYVCACPEAVIEGPTCASDPERSCSSGACVLASCRAEVAAYQRATCEKATSEATKKQCEEAVEPCVAGGEVCKFLPCVDRRIGNFSDGRLKMVGQ
jgi:5'-nucleotidase